MNPIDPRIHQALDGELGRADLPPALRRSVERLDAAAALLATAPAAAGLEARVMADIRRPALTPAARLIRWLTTPHAVTLRVRPLWSLGLAAVLAGAVLVAPEGPGAGPGERQGVAPVLAPLPRGRSRPVGGP